MKRITILLLSLIFILTLVFSGCKSDPCEEGHNFGGWNFLSPVTCIEDGVRVRYCLNEGCGYKETQTISALGHDYQLIEARDSTCTQKGCLEHKECSRCHSLLLNDQPADESDIFLEKIPHDFTILSDFPHPTDNHLRIKTIQCLKCEFQETEEYDPIPWTPNV